MKLAIVDELAEHTLLTIYKGEKVERELRFENKAKVEHALVVNGWIQRSSLTVPRSISVWTCPRYRVEPFVAVSLTEFWEFLPVASIQEAFVLEIEGCNLWTRIALKSAPVCYAFGFQAFSCNSPEDGLDPVPCPQLDPILELVGNGLVKVDLIGYWSSRREAEEMARFFVNRLEARYGTDLFREAVRANILRGLYGEKKGE